MSQLLQVKNYLENGNRITPIEALNKFGSFRLSAIIYDLRQSGMNIKTHRVTVNGKTFAEYELVFEPQKVLELVGGKNVR
tara:strand:- start:1477 stop:1716 length:240 start_codon:yes stop_codon:yes gene_type:complete